jgi:hypothetical protein
MQEAAVTEEPKPFYKKWWLWTIVVVAVVAAVAEADSEGCFGLDCVPPSSPAP